MKFWITCSCGEKLGFKMKDADAFSEMERRGWRYIGGSWDDPELKDIEEKFSSALDKKPKPPGGRWICPKCAGREE